MISSLFPQDPKSRLTLSQRPSLKRRLLEMRHLRETGSDTRFTQGVFALDKLSSSDIKPALTLHLYSNHFTFEGLTGSYSYDGLMRGFLEAIDEQRIPAEVADLFDDTQVQYYDGCLVVELKNHRLGGQVEVRRVLLHPTPESVLEDVYQLSKREPFAEDMWLEVEKKVILATAGPLCLEPTVNVAIVANGSLLCFALICVVSFGLLGSLDLLPFSLTALHYNQNKFYRPPKRRRVDTDLSEGASLFDVAPNRVSAFLIFPSSFFFLQLSFSWFLFFFFFFCFFLNRSSKNSLC